MADREQTIEVYQSFFAVARQLKKLAHQSAADLGLTVHQFGILNSLLQHPGQTQKDVTERMIFNKSRVSLHIDALALKGLVTRAVSELDRRETKLYLTAEGEALCLRYNEEAWSHKVLGDALEQFNEDELRQLIHMNKQLLLQLNP
ncbi:MarR family winged helix-turn-helix transcriptional regulator [Paenibacillus sp. sgz5001063]|uniref:MarR family winged helix-turn-helix transcriptional regulator n=1 Tax=Paenibacillus sp. sgz5001063 TaxID=3242474 RepID=UPI0036D41C36